MRWPSFSQWMPKSCNKSNIGNTMCRDTALLHFNSGKGLPGLPIDNLPNVCKRHPDPTVYFVCKASQGVLNRQSILPPLKGPVLLVSSRIQPPCNWSNVPLSTVCCQSPVSINRLTPVICQALCANSGSINLRGTARVDRQRESSWTFRKLNSSRSAEQTVQHAFALKQVCRNSLQACSLSLAKTQATPNYSPLQISFPANAGWRELAGHVSSYGSNSGCFPSNNALKPNVM